MFATDAEVAAMSPQERALHETQVSLERQKRQLDLRYQAETEKLRMAAEVVNRFRSSLSREEGQL